MPMLVWWCPEVAQAGAFQRLGGQDLSARVDQRQQGQHQPQALSTSLGIGRGQAGTSGWHEGICGPAQPNGSSKRLPKPQMGSGYGQPSGSDHWGGCSHCLTEKPTAAVLHNEYSAEIHWLYNVQVRFMKKKKSTSKDGFQFPVLIFLLDDHCEVSRSYKENLEFGAGTVICSCKNSVV